MWLFCQSKNHKSMQWLCVCACAQQVFMDTLYGQKYFTSIPKSHTQRGSCIRTYISIETHTYSPNLLHSLGNFVNSYTRNYTKLAFVNFLCTSCLCWYWYCCSGCLSVSREFTHFSFFVVLNTFFPFVSLNSLSNNRWLLVGFAY